MAQDTPNGTVIMQISATDVDEGENQRITYNLTASRVRGDIDYFKYNEDTGAVQLARPIDKPTDHIFLLKASASDHGNPPRYSKYSMNL